MHNNEFKFDNQIFLQIFGTAIGKSFAPNLANLYLIDLDNQAMNGFRIKPAVVSKISRSKTQEGPPD